MELKAEMVDAMLALVGRVSNGSTTVTKGLFPKIGPGQWKMDTDHRSVSGTMTMSG